uniref:Putative retrotransposon protein n=1 Tax=Oryza sativa subsp. japonica TaxID=39947 RepID=Q6UUR0_ORYSJ|nr:putative retrotransposon protein [Oryza sativa Japonica Group]
MDISRANEGYTSCGPVVEMSWHMAGILLLGAQPWLPISGVPAVARVGSVLLFMARMGWELCHVFRPYAVVGKKLPEKYGDDAEPRAAWEVTAVILTGSPERTSLAVTAGADSFPTTCQNAALLAIGTLHQRYPDELQHSPYRYHPRRGGARDCATFRDACSEDDATIMHLARMVEAYDMARIDFHHMVAPWVGQEQHEDPGAASGEFAAEEGLGRREGAAVSAQDCSGGDLLPQAPPHLLQPEDHHPQEYLQA